MTYRICQQFARIVIEKKQYTKTYDWVTSCYNKYIVNFTYVYTPKK